MKVYFFSGLGADRRVFRHIQLPAGYEPVFIDWIPPLENESLSSYSFRLSKKIDVAESFSLIGLSMGGMIAAEIANCKKPEHLVLISSIPASNQLPPYYRLLARMKLHRILPISFFLKGAVLKRLFTSESKEDKRLIRNMISKVDVSFIRWGMEAIVNWQMENIPGNIIHIHGSKDEILPRRYTRPTITIPGGGHLMVLNRSSEINKILREIFN
ncbi:MAG TPA: alpha/beta hydrolase [Flavisolibacter sp.]|nr:alpha/beta hydrolase [Flavisolibacter sp.]